jgi:hypothetical protein
VALPHADGSIQRTKAVLRPQDQLPPKRWKQLFVRIGSRLLSRANFLGG